MGITVVSVGEYKVLNFFFLKKIINLYKDVKIIWFFFTGEERRKFAVFIQNFFQDGYEFVTKVINFGLYNVNILI